jgi:hypothetical protein
MVNGGYFMVYKPTNITGGPHVHRDSFFFGIPNDIWIPRMATDDDIISYDPAW